jgi:membrane protease YdiL (CAAX protease family)
VSDPQPRRKLASLTGLFIAVVIPAVVSSIGKGPQQASGDSVALILVNEIFMWGLTLAVLAIVLFWERRPLASIGLVRPTILSFQLGAALTVGILVLAVAIGAVVEAFGTKLGTGAQETLMLGLPVWVQLFAAVSAGFTEEILFRGYAIERLSELTGRRWLAAALTVIIFGGLHAPFWGLAHALAAGFTGLWLTLAYLWRRDLWTNITAHALFDGLLFIVADTQADSGTTEAIALLHRLT